MAGLVIACKTTKDDLRIEEWWNSIQGSKSETLKRVILSYLDGGNNGGRTAPQIDVDPSGGKLATVLESLTAVLTSLDNKLNPDGTMEAIAPHNIPLNSARRSTRESHNHQQQIIDTAKEAIEDADAALAKASGNFLSMFG